VERIDSDKRSSLLRQGTNYGLQRFTEKAKGKAKKAKKAKGKAKKPKRP
jgi:hypothetical protein